MHYLLLALFLFASLPAVAADDPDLIFKKTTAWKLLAPSHKLATYAIDDPGVDGVACHFTLSEKGGWDGWLGFAEELPEVSLSCNQVGPVSIKAKFEQGHEMYEQRRSLFFKRVRIVRGCDEKRNVLVYLMYTDKLIDGSPQNSTSTVPIMPWGTANAPVRCGDFVKG
jgi:CreA protein